SRVFCSFGPGGDDELFTDVRTGIELDVPANTRVICDWYNIPDETRGADGQQQFNLPIVALICDSDPGVVTLNRLDTAGLPEGCSYAEGLGFDVVAEDGSVIGECTTDSDGRCSVVTSAGTTVAVREEPETVPEGYAPQDNPHEVTASPGPGVGVIFVNLPENAG
ncbi:MAG TPA: hypothetical protein VGR16_11220, partial [Thermomicrobiales bacterium]|nr:hypothetical protein [Thermomicrobiales bacterium]